MDIIQILVWLGVGMLLGILSGWNVSSKSEPINFKRLENENKELQDRISYYKKVIKDLVDDNRKLAKENEDLRK